MALNHQQTYLMERLRLAQRNKSAQAKQIPEPESVVKAREQRNQAEKIINDWEARLDGMIDARLYLINAEVEDVREIIMFNDPKAALMKVKQFELKQYEWNNEKK